LNSLSHELRTPISTIIGAVDTLKDNKNKLDDRTQADLLNEIDFASMRLNRQVGNLLNMSRLESGFVTLQRDWTDINELINTIVQNNYMDFQEHEVEILISETVPLFMLDRGLVEQVVYNLLHNAVQYTPKRN
jgi:two-component system, OmpR family, sensor histidine kinase KdpD